MAEVGRGFSRVGRDAVEQNGVAGAADDDAGVAVAGQENAEAAGVEAELVGLEEAGERVPGDDEVELEILELVGGVDDDAREVGLLEGVAELILLVIVGDADGDAVGATAVRRG